MGGRKILVLLHSRENALACVDFVAHLFRDVKLLLVIGFVYEGPEDPVGLETQRKAITRDLQQAYNAHPNIRLMVRNGRILSVDDIARESRYTDLIVMEAGTLDRSLSLKVKRVSNKSETERLHVPVIIVPEAAQEVEEVIITFDGQNPSVTSIKQFCQIMGNVCSDMQVTLLELNHNKAQFLPQEEKLLIEYLRGHCQNLGIYKVSEESPQQILQLINSSKNAIVVAGTLDTLQASLGKLPQLSNQLIQQNNLPGFFGAS